MEFTRYIGLIVLAVFTLALIIGVVVFAIKSK
jgi:hypothetical protein